MATQASQTISDIEEVWFDYSMRHHLSAAHQAVLETQSRNSGSGGSMPGSGGGGFSGGGFGGGGGGSW